MGQFTNFAKLSSQARVSRSSPTDNRRGAGGQKRRPGGRRDLHDVGLKQAGDAARMLNPLQIIEQALSGLYVQAIVSSRCPTISSVIHYIYR